jgi:hypothetical protein
MDGQNDIRVSDPDLVRDIRARAEARGVGVETILREAVSALPPAPREAPWSAEELAARAEWLDAWVKRVRAKLPSDLSSNHDWLYDENGLPL